MSSFEQHTDAPSRNALLIGATSCALLTLLPVAAYQLHLLEHLPDPPGSLFASDKITSSKMAHPLGVPDSLPGLASYGVTLGLVLYAGNHPAWRRILALKLVGDGAIASFNVIRQVVAFGKICSWCTGTAISTGVMVYGGRKIIVKASGH